MLDISKIKTWDIQDLVGRNVTIQTYTDNSYDITMAFDTKTGESFLVGIKPIPQVTVDT